MYGAAYQGALKGALLYLAVCSLLACETSPAQPSSIFPRSLPLGSGVTLTRIPTPSVPGRTKPIGFGPVLVQGDKLVVGTIKLKPATAYIYRRTGASWTLKQKLTTSGSSSGSSPYADYLSTPSLQGRTLVIGAPFTPYPSGANLGAAYVFEHDGKAWSEKQVVRGWGNGPHSHLGPTALRGQYLVAGAPGNGNDPNIGKVAGEAFVFARCGGAWKKKQKLSCAHAKCSSASAFGAALAMSNTTLIVGAPGEYAPKSWAGAAYVYVRKGTTWTVQQRLVASNPHTMDFFGDSVALQGDTAVVGAYGAGGDAVYNGEVYIFSRSGTRWTQSHRLTGPNYGQGIGFGYPVLLRGDVLLVGATWDHSQANFSGSVLVYQRTGGSWKEQNTLLPPKGIAGAAFGTWISFDGRTVAIGDTKNRVFVAELVPGGKDAGPAAPDSGTAGPDPCQDLGPDRTRPDLAAPDAGLPDAGIPDRQGVDQGATEEDNQQGCSCSMSRPGQVDGLARAMGLLALLLIVAWRGSRRRRRPIVG